MQSQSVLSLEQVKAQGQINEADVLKLRRAYYADSTISETEAQALIALNRAVTTPSPVWADCFVEMLTDHVVNQTEPEGYVTVAHAEWLVANLSLDGRVSSRAEFELLINVLDMSRWSPPSLAKFALDQVRDAIVSQSGALAVHGGASSVPHVSEADVESLRRIIYAFGGDSNINITQLEAETMFEINDATVDGVNCESWQSLFVKTIANCVLSASGYVVPSREQALAREAWLDRRGDLSAGKRLSGMLSGYRQLSREEQAIAALERQKVEIVTGEAVMAIEADWLASRLHRDGKLSANEEALIAFLRTECPELHPTLQSMMGLPVAA